MKKFNFNGYLLEYFELFNNKDKNLIFIHGFGSNIEFFSKLITKLSSNYNIYGLNMPAHGDSEYSENLMNFKMFCEIFRQFINFLGLDNITLIGHSLGGGIAAANLNNSNKIKKCVLIGPMNPTSLSRVNEFNECFFPRTVNEWEKLIKLCYYNPEIIIKNPEIRKRTEVYLKDFSVELDYIYQLGRDLPSNTNMEIIDIGLRNFNGEIGLFFGDHDGIIDLKKITPYYRSVSKNLNVYKIKNSGHSIWLENWEDFITNLTSFLEK